MSLLTQGKFFLNEFVQPLGIDGVHLDVVVACPVNPQGSHSLGALFENVLAVTNVDDFVFSPVDHENGRFYVLGLVDARMNGCWRLDCWLDIASEDQNNTMLSLCLNLHINNVL